MADPDLERAREYITGFGDGGRQGRALALLVLMFHDGGQWTPDRVAFWQGLTGTDEATTKTLCDFARKLLEEGG